MNKLFILAFAIAVIVGTAAYAKMGTDTGLSLGAGSVSVGGPVEPPASGTYAFDDTGGHIFDDTGGHEFEDY